MLLTEMVELFSNHFIICNNSITNILENNNIRINQRLLLEKDTFIMNKQELKKQSSNRKSNSNTRQINVSEQVKTQVVAEVVTEVVTEVVAEVKAEVVRALDENKIKIDENKPNIEIKPVRGRGRPRKNTVMKEEEEMCVEVEEIEVDGVKYYKTCENILLSKDLEIEGIFRDGKIVREKDKKEKKV